MRQTEIYISPIRQRQRRARRLNAIGCTAMVTWFGFAIAGVFWEAIGYGLHPAVAIIGGIPLGMIVAGCALSLERS